MLRHHLLYLLDPTSAQKHTSNVSCACTRARQKYICGAENTKPRPILSRGRHTKKTHDERSIRCVAEPTKPPTRIVRTHMCEEAYKLGGQNGLSQGSCHTRPHGHNYQPFFTTEKPLPLNLRLTNTQRIHAPRRLHQLCIKHMA